MATRKLKVALVPLPYFLEVDTSLKGNKRFRGIDGNFLNIIGEYFGFEFEERIPEDEEWGRKKSDGNWSGLIGLVARGEADMAIGSISINAQRLEVIDFSTLYSTEETTFIIENPSNTERSFFAYVLPFDITVWLCFFLTILLFGFLFYRFSGRHLTPGRVLYKLFGSVLGQGFNVNCYSNKEKFLILVWLFFAMMMSLSYSTKMLSSLTVPLKNVPIRNFHEMAKAVEMGTHKCLTWKDGNLIQFLLESKEKHLQNLGKYIQNNEWYQNPSKFASTSEINQYSCVIRSRAEMILFYSSPDLMSKYMISKESLGVWSIGIVLGKNFCCKSKLDNVISRLRSAGIYNKLLRDSAFKLWIKNFDNVEYANRNELSPQLVLKDMRGPLLLVIAGYALSIIILLIEISYFRWRKQGLLFIRKMRSWRTNQT